MIYEYSIIIHTYLNRISLVIYECHTSERERERERQGN